MLNFGNKDFRNLQEQVLFNSNELEALKQLQLGGVEIKGVYENSASLPIPGTLSHAYLVGIAKPYELYVYLTGGYVNMGLFPQAGPQGVVGPQGLQGETGERGANWTIGSFPASANVGDLHVEFDGKVHRKKEHSWEYVMSIRGLQGPQGPKGDKGDTGEQGLQGIEGPAGQAGPVSIIRGVLATIAELPSPETVDANTAYVIDGDLYVLVNGTTLTWQNVGSATIYNGASQISFDPTGTYYLTGRTNLQSAVAWLDMMAKINNDLVNYNDDRINDLQSDYGYRITDLEGNYDFLIDHTIVDIQQDVQNLQFGKENTANKATDFTVINDTKFPTVKAVNDRIEYAIGLGGGGGGSGLTLEQAEILSNLSVQAGVATTTIPMILGSLGGSGEYLEDARKMVSQNFMPITTGDTITISNDANYNIYVRFYDASNVYVSGLDAERGTITFVVPAGVSYFKVRTSTDENVLTTVFSYESSGSSLEILTDKAIMSKAEIGQVDTDLIDLGKGYTLYADAIPGETGLNEVAIQATENEFAILSLKAPEAEAKESTITLMLDDVNTVQFVDISNMRYNTAEQGAMEIVMQKRGLTTPLPYFTINFNDGLGAGRVKKFTVQPDAIPIEMVSTGLKVRRNNNYNNTGGPEEYDIVNLIDLKEGKADKEQEAWITPTLVNSWVQFGSPAYDASYMKDSMGFVHLRGRIKNGVVGNYAFVLPTNYRPTSTVSFAVDSNSAFGKVLIASDGSVNLTVGDNAFVSLDGITFKAEA